MHFLLVWFYFFYATIFLMHMVYDNFIINVIFIKEIILLLAILSMAELSDTITAK